MPHPKGFRSRKDERSLHESRLGEVVDALLNDPAFSRGMPIGQLSARWTDVVGPRLAGESAPVSLDHGVLVVAATTGPWGAQVRFLADQIRRRAEDTIGAGSVVRVHVVVRTEPRKGL
jgi:hypothetical protein